MKAVVLSPHLDDAVLSIGATVNSLRRRGAEVVLLTAFAGDQEHNSRASYWDAKRGAPDKAAALVLREAEDDAAIGVLRVESVRLPFDDFAYVPRRDPDALLAAMAPQLKDADVVLTPGWPLAHPDHRYLSTLVASRPFAAALFFYEEMPYGAQPMQVLKRTLRGRNTPSLAYEVGGELTWRQALTTSDDFAAKRAAVSCYAGEVAALGRRAVWGKLHDRLWRREMVASIEGSAFDEFMFGVRR